jgi:hypothetical protein
MQEKAQSWLDRAKEGHLTRWDVWFLLDKQIWPSAGYGLSSNMAKLPTLDSCLKKQYWSLLPLGGNIQTAPHGICQLDRGFYGAGCPHVGIECMIAQVQTLLTHFGCETSMGLQLKISINCMVIEMGISDQPFQESYKKYNSWVTCSLAKRLWEKLDEFGITVVLGIPDIKLPCKRDNWLMREFVKMG